MRWSSQRVADLLGQLRARGRDFTEIEVKLGAGGCPSVGPTLCAFGNMPDGGTLVIGLDEGSNFAARGVDDPAAIEAGLADQARTSVAPPVRLTFEEADVEGATLVIASVAPLPASQRPCYHQHKAYLRLADGDYAMSEQEIQHVLALRERPRYDTRPVAGSTPDNLDPNLTHAFIEAARRTSRRLADQVDDVILKRTGVLTPDGTQLTVAGLYALGDYPQQFNPSLSITAAVLLDPRSGQRSRDLVHLDGPIPALLDDAMAWVERNTHTTVRFGPDGHGRDVAELPLVAVREIVSNALVHRDLGPHTEGKRVEIRLREDELIVTNPGGLYGVSVAQLGTPLGKSAVNEFLYDICKLVRTPSEHRVIEGEGGGIREVMRALKAANLRAPRLIDQSVRFTAIIPRRSLIGADDLSWLSQRDPSGSLSDIQKQILVSMRHGQRWTNALVREEFPPIDSRDARSLLQSLVALGLVAMDGERGQAEYGLANADDYAVPEPTRIVMRRPSIEAASTEEELPLDTVGREASSRVTRHAPLVWDALAQGPRSLKDVTQSTGLTDSQARHALNMMIRAGLVNREGGQGVRTTKYGRKPRVTLNP